MTQSTIDFLLHNNIAIIQTIFVVIFALVVFVILRSFKEDKSQSTHVAPPSSAKARREEFLAEKKAEEKKTAASADAAPAIPKDDSPLDDLDNLDDLMGADEPKEITQAEINQTLAQAGGAAAAAAPVSNGAGDVELTNALKEKEKVIADLKAELATIQAKPAATAAAADPALEAKVKELSDKLAEYEIIEDDIANLSFYKNENAKLKNELDKLKGGAPAEAALAPAAPAPVVEPKIVDAPAPTAAMPTAPTTPSEEVLNEFEEAVKQKEALEKNLPPSPAPVSIKSDADLLKEFESAVEQEMAAGTLKQKTKPAPLETKKAEDINSDKLVKEMEALAAAKPPEIRDDGKDSNQKLIEEFENFVNKS